MTKKHSDINKRYMWYLIQLVVLIGIASAIGYFFRYIGFPETNIVLVYVLAVLIIACFSKGYFLGIFTSVVATLAFNYFFTPPYFSLSVDDPSYIITFIIMTITSLMTSTLTSRVKQNAIAAKEKEVEAKALYSLTNHLTDAKDMDDIASISVENISQCFNCRAACLCFDEGGIPGKTFIQQVTSHKQVRRETKDRKKIKQRIEKLITPYEVNSEFWDWPIYGREDILGVIRIPEENAENMSEIQIKLLQSMIESTALAMDRFQSGYRQMKAHEETIQERYRANLLRAISHDLRTPLSGIIGTSEMLMDMNSKIDPRYELALGIHKDAEWLHSLVENILSLTRLQDGKLTINKECEVVEEIVGGAVSHILKRAPEQEISVHVPDELLFVPMDGKLIEQVLINLLDNAIKHNSSGREISVYVKRDTISNNAVFSVCDRGKGVKEEDLSILFQAFYTSRAQMPDSKRGIGLGLTICEAIVKAHGGSIEAHNRSDGEGAEFIFTLPLEVEKNEQF